ncbi:hypothetical protein KSZ12_08335 [Parabacteroides distasonis]|uniref:hypothetical protein n=1 Tax=Parabacteroides distasonis TaxID=823 RepID=UPI001C385A7B|nr:hypothetical protein [Parabacteroides distasonis]MBV4225857.1 hypothetical protein [Parabacteroides distasonis]
MKIKKISINTKIEKLSTQVKKIPSQIKMRQSYIRNFFITGLMGKIVTFLFSSFSLIVLGILMAFMAIYFYRNTQNVRPILKQIRVSNINREHISRLQIDIGSSDFLVENKKSIGVMSIMLNYYVPEIVDSSYVNIYREDSLGNIYSNKKYYYITKEGRPIYLLDTIPNNVDSTANYVSSIQVALDDFNEKQIIKEISANEYGCGNGNVIVDSISEHLLTTHFYYDITKESNTFSTTIFGDFLFNTDKNNPYVFFYLILKDFSPIYINESSCIRIDYGHPEDNGFIKNPINITSIYPQPSTITPGSILYKGKEKITEVFQNGCISFSGEDIEKKRQSDQMLFLYTVLFGSCLTFLVQIFISLIVKWRDVVLNQQLETSKTKKYWYYIIATIITIILLIIVIYLLK